MNRISRISTISNKSNFGKVFVCWDLHWDNLYEKDAKKLSPNIWKEAKTLTKNDVLIVLGDFWYIWHTLWANKEQEEKLDLLAELNQSERYIMEK